MNRLIFCCIATLAYAVTTLSANSSQEQTEPAICAAPTSDNQQGLAPCRPFSDPSNPTKRQQDVIVAQEDTYNAYGRVSWKFMDKLTAITDGTGTPAQKLADIDALVKSYGWPATPPAIAHVVEDAREVLLNEKAAKEAEQHPIPDVEGEWAEETGPGPTDPQVKLQQGDKVFSPEDSQELGLLSSVMAVYSIASFCADNGASFTAEEVDRLRSHISKISNKMSLSAEKQDKAWELVQTALPQVTATMTEYDCALERQSYAGLFPEVFVPGDAPKNPF
jgi:hypothetical protein